MKKKTVPQKEYRGLTIWLPEYAAATMERAAAYFWNFRLTRPPAYGSINSIHKESPTTPPLGKTAGLLGHTNQKIANPILKIQQDNTPKGDFGLQIE